MLPVTAYFAIRCQICERFVFGLGWDESSKPIILRKRENRREKKPGRKKSSRFCPML